MSGFELATVVGGGRERQGVFRLKDELMGDDMFGATLVIPSFTSLAG